MSGKINTGRYSVGEEIIACAFIYENTTSIGQPLLVGVKMPTAIAFKKLTVLEHHRVAWAHGDRDLFQHDGYILSDTDGQRFFNQYPMANYTQTSDRSDRVFSIDEKNCSFIDKIGVDAQYNLVPTRFVTICEVYTPIAKALLIDVDSLPKQLVNDLTTFKKMFDDQFNKDFPNLELEVVPIVWKDPNGQDVCLPHILHTKIFEKKVDGPNE